MSREPHWLPNNCLFNWLTMVKLFMHYIIHEWEDVMGLCLHHFPIHKLSNPLRPLFHFNCAHMFISCVGGIHIFLETPLKMRQKKMFLILFVTSLPFITHLMSLKSIIISSRPNEILTPNLQSSPLRVLVMSFHFGMTLHRNQIPAIKRRGQCKFNAR